MSLPLDDVAQPRTAISEPDGTQVLLFRHVPSYQEFLDRCLIPNRPCILPPALVQEWTTVKNGLWQEEGSGQVDWDFLAQKYGHHVSPVVICKKNGDEDRRDMTIAKGVRLIRAFKRGEAQDTQSIYIKDWHLIRQLRCRANGDLTADGESDGEPYTVPDVFADDWMNNISGGDAASAVGDDDFRFVYAGTKKSRTALHRDVYTSYSWSTNVVGRKLWHLFPPSAIPHLRRFPAVETSQLVQDVETLRKDILASNISREYPQLQQAWDQVQIVVQEQGQTIFVPSNWYHQVENLDECISINHNWCNSVNIPSLYSSIKQELDHVEKSLSDVRDMLRNNKHEGNTAEDLWRAEFAALVQDVATKDAGWAWHGFWHMVQHNLHTPAAQQSARPTQDWVRNRIMHLIIDFESDPNTQHLTSDIVKSANECRLLLESM